MRILYHPSGSWTLWIQFQTNSPNTTTFDPEWDVDTSSYNWKMDYDDGTEELTSPSFYGWVHTYADGTVKTVSIYYQVWDWNTLNSIEMASDHIYGDLDLSDVNIVFGSAFNLRLDNNSELTDVIFDDSDFGGGKIGTWTIINCDMTDTFDMSMWTCIKTNAWIQIENNPNLTAIDFPSALDSGCTGTLYVLDLGRNDLSSLDISAFTAWASNAIIRVDANSSLSSVTFPASMTGSISYIEFPGCALTDNIDISFIPDFTGNVSIIFDNNSGITGLTFPSGPFSGSLLRYAVANCNISGDIDLTDFVNFGAAVNIYVNGNSGITDVIFADSDVVIPGVLQNFYGYDCDLTGILDLSMFGDIYTGAGIRVYNNSNLTGIDLMSNSGSTGTLATFIANDCDLGYIDFTGIPNCTDRNSCIINLNNNTMTESEVDDILVDLDTISSGGYTGRFIYIAGGDSSTANSPPSATGLTAKTSLEGKGFTVNVNS